MINFSVLSLSTLELFCVTCLINGLSTILKVKKKKAQGKQQQKRTVSKKQIANNSCM